MQSDSTVLEMLREQIDLVPPNDFVHPDCILLRAHPAGYQGRFTRPADVGVGSRLLGAARRAEVLCVFVPMLGDLKYVSSVQQALSPVGSPAPQRTGAARVRPSAMRPSIGEMGRSARSSRSRSCL